MEEKLSSQQVDWNLAAAILGEIQQLLGTATRLYLAGNITKAFWTLKAVKFRFIQSLNEDERKNLKRLEKKFRKYINRSEAKAYVYDLYQEVIMDLLETYGYLIQKKKDSHRIS
ncbi:hypothetical protein LCGC14_0730130 [marine sediment metagenome]|uniref:Uncharacterized protein n=1 Tax=marine sediment metagenome TaxID=412755 RepID=A0A0F9QV11_9ZZZZ